ncbi:delta-aminolevulinic acid dehydratase [Opitutia bacterium SCGC AG-212-L18]|nr:delta-aminolevulinic acid dehydratase [Opitutae bacterium SCGC AG-212-L18]
MNDDYILDLIQRPRRLRKSHAIRSLVQETWLRTEDFVQPLFVIEGDGDPVAIPSMPGIKRLPIKHLLQECEELSALDIRAIALFPSMITQSKKNAMGTEALNSQSFFFKAIRSIKENIPELAVITDIALDPYTTHGHDGILNKNGTDIDNDKTVAILCAMALLQAEAGVDFVAPSDMMDGRIGAIRASLDDQGHTNTGIIAYSSKFDSAYYAPFREAVGSASNAQLGNLSKKTYQLNPANRKEAILESLIDESEGADILMVKPAGLYLDIIRDIKNECTIPLAAYQVTGEYSMLQAAAEKKWIDLNRAREESLIAIKRAGADIIFTYFAKEQAQIIKSTY